MKSQRPEQQSGKTDQFIVCSANRQRQTEKIPSLFCRDKTTVRVVRRQPEIPVIGTGQNTENDRQAYEA